MQATQVFKLKGSGLNRVLGKLESQVMDALWEKNQATIKTIQVKIFQKTPLSFNTVMTAMNRLVGKGLLKKKKVARHYLYTPVVSKEDFLNSFSEKVIQGLIKEFPQYAIANFVEEVEKADPKLLDELWQVVKERRNVKKCE